MLDHHRQAVDRLTAELSPNPHFLAVLLAGSIARGTERPDSDVDLILLATDEESADPLLGTVLLNNAPKQGSHAHKTSSPITRQRENVAFEKCAFHMPPSVQREFFQISSIWSQRRVAWGLW